MHVPWSMKDKYNFLTFKNVYLMHYLRIISLRNSLQNKWNIGTSFHYMCVIIVNFWQIKKTIILPSLIKNNEYWKIFTIKENALKFFLLSFLHYIYDYCEMFFGKRLFFQISKFTDNFLFVKSFIYIKNTRCIH